MAHTHPIAHHQDTDDVEPIGLVGTAVPIDPDLRRLGQLLLFSPVNRFYRLAEAISPARLDLHERNRPLALDDEIDIPVPGSESPLHDPPPRPPEPSLGDSLAQLPELLPGR